MDLSDVKPIRGTNYHASLPDGLLQHGYTDEETLQEMWWQRSACPQRKILPGHMKLRHLGPVAPDQVQGKPELLTWVIQISID